jgi:hypothetical protein
MTQKLKRAWERYDGVILPVLLALITMWGGILIGKWSTLNDQALMCSKRVEELGNELGIRSSLTGEPLPNSLIETNKATAEAARLSAEAAKKSADAAKRAAGQTHDPLRIE